MNVLFSCTDLDHNQVRLVNLVERTLSTLSSTVNNDLLYMQIGTFYIVNVDKLYNTICQPLTRRPDDDPAFQGGDLLRPVQAGVLLGRGPSPLRQLQGAHALRTPQGEGRR